MLVRIRGLIESRRRNYTLDTDLVGIASFYVERKKEFLGKP